MPFSGQENYSMEHLGAQHRHFELQRGGKVELLGK
jgi:hypothetical protein